MAMTVSASIQLNDMMSGPIMHIMSALDAMCNHLELVDAAIGKGFDSSDLYEVRQHIDTANAELDEMRTKIENVNNATNKVANSTDDWLGKISKIGAGYLSLRTVMEGVKFAVDISDEMTLTTARLGLIVDDGGSVEVLEDKIRASAERSRASYQTTADAVAKLGMQAADSFSNSDELIAFTELLNKTFVTTGTSAQGIDSVMLQLTQSMAAGKLQGEELNAVLDNAQPIVENIKNYLEEVEGIDATNIKELASDGELTADVIKNAMFYAADEINAKFEKMPMTWEQIWIGFENDAREAFKPLMSEINEIANSPTMQRLFADIGNALVPVANALTWIVDKVSEIGGAVVDNWDIIRPILLGCIGVLGGLKIATILVSVAMGITSFASAVCGVALAAFRGAAVPATAAQWGLNAAIYACPLTWIVIAIVIAIAAFYALIAVINKLMNKSISATGIIFGCITTVLAFTWNTLLAIVDLTMSVVNVFINAFKTVGNFLANVFVDPVASVIYLFRDMANTVLSFLQSIAASMDKIFGTNQAEVVGNWMKWVDDKAEKLVNELSPDSNYEKVFNIETYTSEDFGVKRLGYYDSFMNGYNWGANLFKFEDPFDSDDDEDDKGFEGVDLSGLVNGTDETAGNTKKIADNTEKATSLLELVKDNWEKEAIMKYTSSVKTITYDLSGMTNTYNNTGEAFDAVKELGRYLNRKMSTSAEGV